MNPDEPKQLEVPVVVGGVEEYKSSEELQRAHRNTFVDNKKKEEEQQRLTDKQRLHRTLDKHVAK